MSLAFSKTIKGQAHRMSAAFEAASVDFVSEHGFTSPVMQLDHFRMSDVTFAPHPHAGFSAISYMFDDSAGAMRNRDSLGHDFVVGPGGIIWTQAGTGVMHDELPDVVGKEVHGLQIFINLSSAAKRLSPAVFHHDAEDLPVVADASGNSIKVVVGRFGDAVSPLVPAEQVQFYDVHLVSEWDYRLAEGLNVNIYVAEGKVAVRSQDDERKLDQHDALGVNGEGGIRLAPLGGPARVVLLAGTALDEPLARYGPFAMNNREQLEDAIVRYQAGEMGNLAPLPHGSAH